MNKDEAKEFIKTTVQEKMSELAGPAIEAKGEELEKKLEEKIAEFNPTPTKEEIAANKAQEEVDKMKFKGFNDMLHAVWQYRAFNQTDNRLVYVNSQGQPIDPIRANPEEKQSGILKTMTEGTDSAGGYY